jgi:hypothetical protein
MYICRAEPSQLHLCQYLRNPPHTLYQSLTILIRDLHKDLLHIVITQPVVDGKLLLPDGGKLQVVGPAIVAGHGLGQVLPLFKPDDDLTQVALVDIQQWNDGIGRYPRCGVDGMQHPKLGKRKLAVQELAAQYAGQRGVKPVKGPHFGNLTFPHALKIVKTLVEYVH